MTTFAFRKYKNYAVVAADTFITGDWPGPENKIYHNKDIVYVGAGSYTEVVRQWRMLDEHGFNQDDRTWLKKGPDAIVWTLKKKQLWYYDTKGPWFPIEHAFFAGGSGAAYAIGALKAGASAKEAVEIAAECDPHTGKPVNTYQVRL